MLSILQVAVRFERLERVGGESRGLDPIKRLESGVKRNETSGCSLLSLLRSTCLWC